MTLFYLVKIKYKEPEAVVYKNMNAIEFPYFLDFYPDIALEKGLKVDRITVEKKYEELDNFMIKNANFKKEG